MQTSDQRIEDAILKVYLQHGGGNVDFPVYRGPQFQYGKGIGDIFRSIGRFLLPIFSSTASNFIQSTSRGLQEGQPLQDAAKGALKPALGAALQGTSQEIFKRIGRNQNGTGRKPRRKQPKRKAKKRVYKGAGKPRKRRSPRKPKKSKVTTVRFLPTNF